MPGATYFVRAYAYNSDNVEVAYGQTTDTHKTTNLFEIQAITGRHVSLDIASACFSGFSVVSLIGFFVAEKRRAKMSQQKWKRDIKYANGTSQIMVLQEICMVFVFSYIYY